MGFGKQVYARSATEAKLLGILEGLYIVEARHISRATIYTDCRSAVDLIHTEGTIDKYYNRVFTCRQRSTRYLELHIRHCDRSFNQSTDILAKNCSNFAVRLCCKHDLLYPS